MLNRRIEREREERLLVSPDEAKSKCISHGNDANRSSVSLVRSPRIRPCRLNIANVLLIKSDRIDEERRRTNSMTNEFVRDGFEHWESIRFDGDWREPRPPALR